MKGTVFTIKAIALALMFSIIICAPFSDSWSMSETLGQLFLLASLCSFLAMIMDSKRGGVAYMFEFFMVFFIALPAWLQVSTHYFPWFATLNPEHICYTYGFLATSYLCYHLGLAWQQSRSCTNVKTHLRHLSDVDALYYTRWAWLFACIAIVLAVGAGPSSLFTARFDTAANPYQGISQQFLFMSRSLSLLAMVMLVFLVRFTRNTKLRLQNTWALVLFSVPFLVINYLPALPRFVLFGILLALSTLFTDYFKPRNKAWIAVASISMLFILFPVIKSLGAGEFSFSQASERANFSVIESYLLRVDFDAFMQIVSTVEYYSEHLGPIRYGENFLGVVLFFVPRAIWPGKPIDTGEIISTNLGYLYTNVSSPLPAEALMAFGLLGPAIVFFVLAFSIANVESRARFSNTAMPVASSFFLYALFMGFIVIIMRGALNGVAPQFATAFLAFFCMQALKQYQFIVKRNV